MARVDTRRERARAIRLAHALGVSQNIDQSACVRATSVDQGGGRAIESWLARPVAGILDPGERHWDILRRLLHDGQAIGPLVMDAVLAALAIEHGANLCTTDRDFSRFPGLDWTNPLTGRGQ